LQCRPTSRDSARSRSGALRSEAEAERKELPPNMGLCQIKVQLEHLVETGLLRKWVLAGSL
jgi:hypothetical protein